MIDEITNELEFTEKPLVDLDREVEDEPDYPDRMTDLTALVGMIRTRTAVPTGKPKKFSEQIWIVVSGGNASLYAYDTKNNLWRSATLISS